MIESNPTSNVKTVTWCLPITSGEKNEWGRGVGAGRLEEPGEKLQYCEGENHNGMGGGEGSFITS